MFEIETTNVFLENATQAQPSPSATLESTSAFTVTTMSNKADTSVFLTTATTQRKTSSRTTGITKTSVAHSSITVHSLLRITGFLKQFQNCFSFMVAWWQFGNNLSPTTVFNTVINTKHLFFLYCE